MKIRNHLLTQLLLSVVWASVASAQSIAPRVCVEPSFGGLTAVFGYESSEPNPTTILVGPSNNLSPASANPTGPLHTVFYPGFQEGFAIFFFPTEANPTLTWTLLGQSVSADWNTRLCSSQSDFAIAISDGVSVVMPGTTVSYTVNARLAGLDANQSVFATVTDTFPVQCSSVSWTCQGDAGSRCTASGTGDIDDLVFLTPGAGVTYLASCAIAAAASGSLSNFAEISSEATDLAPFNNQAADVNAVVSTIFTINSASAVEGNSGAAPMRFSITRTGGVGAQTVNVASASGGSATAGVDYTPLASTLLSFAPGVNTRSVDVQILGDSTQEPDETLNLILASPSSGTGINEPIGVGSIIDDDTNASNTTITSVLPAITRPFEPITVRVAVRRAPPLSTPAPGLVLVRDGPLGALLTASCTINLQGAANEVGTCLLHSNRSGTFQIVAEYQGLPQLLASSATAAHTVREFRIDPLPVASARILQPVAIGVTLDLDGRPGAPRATGTITVSDGSNSCEIAAVSNTLRCTYLPTGAPGIRQLVASYSGDANYPALRTAAIALPVGPQRFPDLTSRTSIPALAQPARNFFGASDNGAVSADGRFAVTAGPQVYLHDLRTGFSRRISQSASGEAGNSISVQPTISADGRFVAFASLATNLPGAAGLTLPAIYLFDQQGASLRAITPAGALGISPSISANGSLIAFTSTMPVLPEDTNNSQDVYLFDTRTNVYTRASVSTAGVQGDGNSDSASISADGQWLAFRSDATNLAPNVAAFANQREVYLRNLSTGALTLVTRGAGGPLTVSQEPALSGDGSALCFTSFSDELVPGDSNGVSDVFVFDRSTFAYSRVSVSSTGEQGDQLSVGCAISRNGRFVAFESQAPTLVSGDNNGARDVFVHDRQDASTRLASVTSAGESANGESRFPAVSDSGDVLFGSDARNLDPDKTGAAIEAYWREGIGRTTALSVRLGPASANGPSTAASTTPDGRFVVFASSASNLLGDDNAQIDIYLRDRASEQLELISVSSAGVQANGGSANAAISDDGRFVVFDSAANNLAGGDSNNARDVFLRDRQLGTTVLVSAAGAAAGNLSSERPDISGNGAVLVFDSRASNLVAGDSNGVADIFAYTRVSGALRRVSAFSDGRQADAASNRPRVNRDGLVVVFESQARNLTSSLLQGSVDHVYRIVEGSNNFEMLSQSSINPSAGGRAFRPSLSADGLVVAFDSDASDLLPGDNNGVRDVFVRGAIPGSFRRVSEAAGNAGNAASSQAAISPNGGAVLFESAASNLVDGDSNGVTDLFILDVSDATSQPARVNLNFTAAQANLAANMTARALSDAGIAAFASSASNLVLGDENGFEEVFVALVPGFVSASATTTEILSDTPDPTAANQSYTVNVRVTRSGGIASVTGFVDVVDDAGDACRARLSGGGAIATGSCELASARIGTRELRARYLGGSFFAQSVSAPATHTVTAAVLAGFSVIGDSPDPSRLERTVTFTWALAPSRRPVADPTRAINPTGSVTVKEAASCSAPAVIAQHQCSASLPASSCQIAFSAVGIKHVVLCYSGDASFAPASASETHEVINATVPVTLAWLRSSRVGDAIEVQFATASNLGTTGFDLAALGTGLRASRASSGAALSGVSDLLASAGDASRSHSYQLRGRLLGTDTFYLRAFDSDGSVQSFGPFAVGSTHGSDPAEGELSGAQIRSDWNAVRAELAARPTNVRSASSLVGVYVDVTQAGIQRVSAAQLRAAGFTLLEGVPISELALSIGQRTADAAQIQAVPMAITSNDALWNSDDALIFIGEPVDTQHSGTQVYTLSQNARLAQRISMKNAAPDASPPIRVLSQTRLHQQRLLFSPTSVGSSPWTWARIAASTTPVSHDIGLNLTNVLSGAALLKLRLQGGVDHDGAALDHHVQISLNGTQIGAMRFDGLRVFEQTLSVPAGVLTSGVNTLRLRLPADTGLPSDVVFLESVELEANETLRAHAGTAVFTLPALSGSSDVLFADSFENASSGNTAESAVLAISGLASDAWLIQQSAAGTVQLQGAVLLQNELRVSSAGAARLFAANTAHVPGFRAIPSAADLIGSAQYLVITHASFIDALSPLLAARRAQGLSTKLVSIEQIYARSGGVVSPAALRDYLRLAKAQMGTQYVLLVGGDTLDARGFQNSGSISLLPTDYVQTSQLVRFAPSDAALVDFDHNGAPDLAIGRFPVRSQTELAHVLAKTLRPATGNRALLIGDTPEPGLRFAEINDGLQALLSRYSVRRGERENLSAPQVRQMIVDEVNQGLRFVQYLGHAGPMRWSFDNVLDVSTLSNGSLSNTSALSVLQLACWTNYFIEPSHNSLGHAWLNQNFGAARVLGPSVLTELSHSEALAKLLLPKLNSGMALGLALLEAKQALALSHPEYLDVLLGVNLLGDPVGF